MGARVGRSPRTAPDARVRLFCRPTKLQSRAPALRSLIVSAAVRLGAVSLARAQGDNGEKLINASDCTSCHSVDQEVVGPPFSAIAKRYAGQADAQEKLAAKIRDGGSGMT